MITKIEIGLPERFGGIENQSYRKRRPLGRLNWKAVEKTTLRPGNILMRML